MRKKVSCLHKIPPSTFQHTNSANQRRIKLLGVNDNGLETLEVGDSGDDSGEGVESLLGALLVVSLSLESDSESLGDVLDTLAPDGLVELGVDSNVLGAHVLGSELLDRLQGPGSPLLEGPSVDVPKEGARKEADQVSWRNLCWARARPACVLLDDTCRSTEVGERTYL